MNKDKKYEVEGKGINFKKFLDEIVRDSLEIFKMFTAWSNEKKESFKVLLDKLQEEFDKEKETQKDKGDRLEKLVEFIINESYFFEVFKNVHTETNEIDDVIVLSDRGKQALSMFGLSKDLIPIDESIFLGECKNYNSRLGVTYVGKFYSLMIASNVNFGIIFTKMGLSGKPEGYKDAYGLAKVLRMIENSKGKDFYILTFTLDDYKKMLEGETFFELIKAKKLELQLASDYNNFIRDNQHPAENEIKKILNQKASDF